MKNGIEQLISTCHEDWQAYINHPFVKQLAQGSLETICFQHYLKQDYLFLIQFARAWGLAIFKSRNIDEIREALESAKTIVDVELSLHLDYCRQWGIQESDLMQLQEAKATMAYTRYVLDVGQQGDLVDLHIALLPCLMGYHVIAQHITQQQPYYQKDNNPYQSWIDMYISHQYTTAVEQEMLWLNQQLSSISTHRFEQLSVVFRNATRLEADFWQMGLTLAD